MNHKWPTGDGGGSYWVAAKVHNNKIAAIPPCGWECVEKLYQAPPMLMMGRNVLLILESNGSDNHFLVAVVDSDWFRDHFRYILVFFLPLSSIMQFALHTRASNDVKRPFRKELQRNLYRRHVGGCCHCSQAPYHPPCGFDACFVVFFCSNESWALCCMPDCTERVCRLPLFVNLAYCVYATTLSDQREVYSFALIRGQYVVSRYL